MNEVALVTGAAGALGGEVVRVLAARGDAVALMGGPAARDRLERLAASLPGAHCVVTGDATSEAAWKDALARVDRDLRRPPSVAAFVAGGWKGGKALHEETDDAVWRSMLEANLETVHRGLRALLPGMVSRKHGSIVVVGSRAAVDPESSARAAAYATSKAAVVALARVAAAEVRDSGVRVNAVLPSTMDTPANRAAMPSADPSRWVSLSSVAGVVAFLLSEQARDISGAALPVYGRA